VVVVQQEAREGYLLLEDGMSRIKEIKERCEKAHPGPWTYNRGSVGCYHVMSDDRDFETGCIMFKGDSKATADFIAHSREDIPFLLDINADLLAACEAARQIIESRDAMFTPAIRDRAIEVLEKLNEAIDRARGGK
jgi:hypothetical protein